MTLPPTAPPARSIPSLWCSESQVGRDRLLLRRGLVWSLSAAGDPRLAAAVPFYGPAPPIPISPARPPQCLPVLHGLSGVGPLLLRVMVGVTFLAHGWPKLTGGGSGLTMSIARLGIPAPTLVAWLVIVLEVAGGVMFIAGLLTRLVLAIDQLTVERRRPPGV